jgi:hypothetical protein
MSISTKPRVERSPLKRKFTKSTYRKAKPFLLRDFGGRCAYSLQHVDRVGYKCMEVDHFNPTLKGAERNKYSNLFPATRHCNGSKSDEWPSVRARKAGLRFLNPCQEQDYGVHIFEDPRTHELIGLTPAGKYHLRYCDLNAPHLILERKERAQLRALLNSCPVTAKIPIPALYGTQTIDCSVLLRAIVDKMIPPIPVPPAS